YSLFATRSRYGVERPRLRHIVDLACQVFEPARDRAAVGPVEQLHGVDDGDVHARPELSDAADVAGGNHVGTHRPDAGGLAVAHLARDLGLQNVVGAGRAAAQVPLRDLDHGEAGVAEQLARLLVDALAVLHGAGRVIGDAERGPALRRPHVVG